MKSRTGWWTAVLALTLSTAAAGWADGGLEWIRVSGDGRHFERAPSGERFVVWGVNYDHDGDGRLIEDYWDGEWPVVEEDFREIKALGANVVRVHLQFGRFMKSPDTPEKAALGRLADLLRLAEKTGLYLDLTGLGCYHKKDIPPWYDGLSEPARWDAQAVFWGAVAAVCSNSPAVFCYDLMNEPILPGAKPEKEWLGGELGGKFFVQRLSLDLAGRTREQVAKAWVEKMTGAIRARDTRHLITVGEIPWAFVFPGAKPLFDAKNVGAKLDFVSVHFYPKKGEVEKALKALAVYEIGKPLVVEEMFPLACGVEELDAFIEGGRGYVDGWIGFYWGRTSAEYAAGKPDIAGAITKGWLDYFQRKAPAMREAR